MQIHAWQLWIPALLCELGVHPGVNHPDVTSQSLSTVPARTPQQTQSSHRPGLPPEGLDTHLDVFPGEIVEALWQLQLHPMCGSDVFCFRCILRGRTELQEDCSEICKRNFYRVS